MSLSSALSSAASGLTAAGRAAELVSNNVANAQTDGYGRRELQLAPRVVGGAGIGVDVVGVERVVNQTAIDERRLASAEAAFYDEQAQFYSALELAVGSPEQPSSLAASIADFEAQLISAQGSPENDARLAAILSSANRITDVFQSASSVIQSEREAADLRIAVQVQRVNEGLEAVADLNVQIRFAQASNSDATGLMDQRQRAIDAISELIPIKEEPSDHNMIFLRTQNGTTLVGPEAARFEFTSTPVIDPEMSLGSGALSGLTLANASSVAGSVMDVISGGAIAANFSIRDSYAPEAQAALDSLARDLIERSESPDADPSLAGAAGLFTDAGVAFDPLQEIGLANRISVNTVVDPAQGGEIWRIRDGMTAIAPGPVGDTSRLAALSGLMSGTIGPSAIAISSEVAALASSLAQSRLSAETDVSFAQAQMETFQAQENAAGVDTDQEMQKLLVIEQSYAANARLIQAIDEMIQSLLRI